MLFDLHSCSDPESDKSSRDCCVWLDVSGPLVEPLSKGVGGERESHRPIGQRWNRANIQGTMGHNSRKSARRILEAYKKDHWHLSWGKTQQGFPDEIKNERVQSIFVVLESCFSYICVQHYQKMYNWYVIRLLPTSHGVCAIFSIFSLSPIGNEACHNSALLKHFSIRIYVLKQQSVVTHIMF